MIETGRRRRSGVNPGRVLFFNGVRWGESRESKKIEHEDRDIRRHAIKQRHLHRGSVCVYVCMYVLQICMYNGRGDGETGIDDPADPDVPFDVNTARLVVVEKRAEGGRSAEGRGTIVGASFIHSVEGLVCWLKLTLLLFECCVVCHTHAVFFPPQGLTVPSESSTAVPRRETHKVEGAIVEGKETGGSSEAVFSEESESEESRGGRKTPRWWMPERLRSSSEVRRAL